MHDIYISHTTVMMTYLLRYSQHSHCVVTTSQALVGASRMHCIITCSVLSPTKLEGSPLYSTVSLPSVGGVTTH